MTKEDTTMRHGTTMNRAKGAEIETARRAAEAVRLRVEERLTYREIAERLGVSHETARRWLRGELGRLDAETQRNTRQMRAQMNLELNALQDALWAKALGGDVGAIDTCLRIFDRRAKLNGLDRPSETIPPAERFARAWKIISASATDAELEAMRDGYAPAWVAALLPPEMLPAPPTVEVEGEDGQDDIDAEWRPVDHESAD